MSYVWGYFFWRVITFRGLLLLAFTNKSKILQPFSKDHYNDYQLSKAWRKCGDQVFMFNLSCCHGQLAPFPVATCWPLTSLAAKRTKLQAAILLPLEKMKAACGNTVILSPKLCHQNYVAPSSTDNCSNSGRGSYYFWHFLVIISRCYSIYLFPKLPYVTSFQAEGIFNIQH